MFARLKAVYVQRLRGSAKHHRDRIVSASMQVMIMCIDFEFAASLTTTASNDKFCLAAANLCLETYSAICFANLWHLEAFLAKNMSGF